MKRGLRSLWPREHTSWRGMRERCSNPRATGYRYYGAKGIRVCPEWATKDGFAAFLAYMGPRPAGHSIDRIDSSGNYEPGNVRWADKRTQHENRNVTEQGKRNGAARRREFYARKKARFALNRYGRLLGYGDTQRLMGLIRCELEAAFGPPAPPPVPTEMLCIEEAWLSGDWSFESDHFEGLHFSREENWVDLTKATFQPAWFMSRTAA